MKYPITILPHWWGILLIILLGLNASSLTAQNGEVPGNQEPQHQSTSRADFSGATLTTGASYNPLLTTWSVTSEWNYWVSAQSGLSLGNVPFQVQIQHHSNRTYSRLSDQFSLGLDPDRLRQQLAGQIREQVMEEIGNPEAVREWTALQTRQKQIESVLQSEHLQPLLERDSLKRLLAKQMGNHDLEAIKDSIDLLEAKQRGQELSEKQAKQLAGWQRLYREGERLLAKIRSIEVDKEWETYKNTLDAERTRIEREKEKIAAKYNLDETSLSKLETLTSDPDVVIHKLGDRYLSKGQHFLSGMESLHTGRFNWEGNPLFLQGATVSGGEAGYNLNGQTFGAIAGRAHLLNVHSLYQGTAEVEPHNLWGLKLGRTTEHHEIALLYYSLKPVVKKNTEEQGGMGFIGLEGSSALEQTNTQVTYSAGTVRPLSDGPQGQSPVLDWPRLAANGRLKQGFWKQQVQVQLSGRFVGTEYVIPGNPYLVPGSQSVHAAIQFRPSGKPYRIGLIGSNEHRVPLFGQNRTIIQQGGVQGVWRFSKQFMVRAQVAPYSQNTGTSQSTALQSLATLTWNWAWGELNNATEATFNRQGLEVLSGPDSIYTYAADQYTLTQQLEVSQSFRLEASGSMYATGSGMARKVGGALVVSTGKPRLRIQATGNYYWNHPLFNGAAYSMSSTLDFGNFSLQAQGAMHNETIQWIHTPFTFSATAKYTIR